MGVPPKSGVTNEFTGFSGLSNSLLWSELRQKISRKRRSSHKNPAGSRTPPQTMSRKGKLSGTLPALMPKKKRF
ncbi:hypothetical protein LEP1GSC052_4016 [Leptospira kmetyi serovar Malaysia str. Bejo-Iso9]|nr:hypothetical protein LEP1GSC052_4016 [Leptospira kmetyi serovar Malaysia str. Bejo-Iso9]